MIAAITQWASSSTTTCGWKWLCGSSCTRRSSYGCTCTSECRSIKQEVVLSTLRTSHTSKVTGSSKADELMKAATMTLWLEQKNNKKKKVFFSWRKQRSFVNWQLLWLFRTQISFIYQTYFNTIFYLISKFPRKYIYFWWFAGQNRFRHLDFKKTG